MTNEQLIEKAIGFYKKSGKKPIQNQFENERGCCFLVAVNNGTDFNEKEHTFTRYSPGLKEFAESINKTVDWAIGAIYGFDDAEYLDIDMSPDNWDDYYDGYKCGQEAMKQLMIERPITLEVSND